MVLKRSSYLDSPLAKKFYQKWPIIELWCQNQSWFICVEDQTEHKLPFITGSNKRSCSRNPKPTIISFVWKIYQDVPGTAECYILEKNVFCSLSKRHQDLMHFDVAVFNEQRREHFILLKTKQNKCICWILFLFFCCTNTFWQSESWHWNLHPCLLFVSCWEIQYLLGIKKSSKSVTSVQLSNLSFTGRLAVICSFKYQLMSQMFPQDNFQSEIILIIFPAYIHLSCASGHHRFSKMLLKQEQLNI